MSLGDLVTRLARRHTERVKITDRETGIPEVIEQVRGPLLDDLEDASIGTVGGSGTASPGSRIIIHSDVLELQQRIRGELIRDLIRLGVTIPVSGLVDLTGYWYQAWRDSHPNPAEEPAWVEALARWEDEIRALLEPVKRMPMRHGEPCPLCGSSRIVDGGESMIALWIEFSEDSPEETVRLVCKACGPVVHGGGTAGIATLLGIKRDTITPSDLSRPKTGSG